MFLRIHKTWRWLAGIGAVLVILLGWAATQRIADVAAVQDAVERDQEVYLCSPDASLGKPPILPAWIDEAAANWIDRHYSDAIRGDDRWPPALAYRERFRALFRGQIRDIYIAAPIGFRGDLGAAMARFPMLRRVIISEFDDGNIPSEQEWKGFFTHLCAFPRLEEIDIEGAGITDNAIAPLAGHPRLQRVRISAGRLTEMSAKTFATLPHLTLLRIEQREHGDVWLTPGADANEFFTRLRTSVHLEEIELDGPWITDEAIAPLAGHPQLRRILLSETHLTEKSVNTFATLSRLVLLRVEQDVDVEAPLTPEQKESFAARLPGVTVELSD